jgi:hypothetical protein
MKNAIEYYRPIFAYLRQHMLTCILAIAFTLFGCTAMILLDIHMGHRAVAHYPPRLPTFTLNDSEPLAAQLAAHPGKSPRTHRTGAEWQAMHEADLRRIAELESRIAAGQHEAVHAQYAGK